MGLRKAPYLQMDTQTTKIILQIRRNKSENAAVKSSSFSARAHGPQIYRVRWFGFIIDGPKKVFE